MNCPKCASRFLRVEMAFTGQVSCAFSNGGEFEVIDRVALDSEWDDRSPCECLLCAWRGPLGEARRKKRSPPQSKPARKGNPLSAMMSAEEIQAVRDQLKIGHCHPIWRAHLERLLEEVERLNALLDTITRVNAHENDGRRRRSENDTLIG